MVTAALFLLAFDTRDLAAELPGVAIIAVAVAFVKVAAVFVAAVAAIVVAAVAIVVVGDSSRITALIAFTVG
jgi:hypothetical protein